MPACPLTSQPSHHQSPPSHRVYRKPSVRLSRHVTSHHVTSPVDVVRCVVATCTQHTTAQQPKTTVSVRRRRCRSTASARDCHLRKKKQKKEPETLLFSVAVPLPSSPPSLHCKKTGLNRNKKIVRRSTAGLSPSITTLLLLLLLFHQPPPPPPLPTTTTTTTTTNHQSTDHRVLL